VRWTGRMSAVARNPRATDWILGILTPIENAGKADSDFRVALLPG
jgi:hypothetical protein